jgi:hypothetical protein
MKAESEILTQESNEAAKRALRVAEQTRQIGADTLSKLDSMFFFFFFFFFFVFILFFFFFDTLLKFVSVFDISSSLFFKSLLSLSF